MEQQKPMLERQTQQQDQQQDQIQISDKSYSVLSNQQKDIQIQIFSYSDLSNQQHDQQQNWIQTSHQSERSNQYSDWMQNLFISEQQGIRQNRRFRVPISEGTPSLKQSQSSYQWTISYDDLQQLLKRESDKNYCKKLPMKSQIFKGQPPQTNRIKQDFDSYINKNLKNLEPIPQQQQLFRYHKNKQKNQQKFQSFKIFKRTCYIKEVIDNSQTVKILQINQMWGKRDYDSPNIFKRAAILIKRINIILNEKSERKQLDLSKTNADAELFKLIQNNLQQLQSLKIVECKLLSYVLLSGLSQLKHIDVSRTSIKTVKLSQLQNLQSFRALWCNYLSNLTFIKCQKVVKINVLSCLSLVSLISQHLQQLQKINLICCQRFIWDNILKCRKLCNFMAQQSNLSIQYANIILQNNPNLQQLELSCNQINEKLNLNNNKQIRKLHIYKGQISQLNLHNLNKLEELKLSYFSNLNQLVVKQCKNLKQLQFNRIDFDYIQFQDNSSIQQIRFYYCFSSESKQFKMKFTNMHQKIKIYFNGCYVSHQLINQLLQLQKNHPQIKIFVDGKGMFDDFQLSQSFSMLQQIKKWI